MHYTLSICWLLKSTQRIRASRLDDIAAMLRCVCHRDDRLLYKPGGRCEIRQPDWPRWAQYPVTEWKQGDVSCPGSPRTICMPVTLQPQPHREREGGVREIGFARQMSTNRRVRARHLQDGQTQDYVCIRHAGWQLIFRQMNIKTQLHWVYMFVYSVTDRNALSRKLNICRLSKTPTQSSFWLPNKKELLSTILDISAVRYDFRLV